MVAEACISQIVSSKDIEVPGLIRLSKGNLGMLVRFSKVVVATIRADR